MKTLHGSTIPTVGCFDPSRKFLIKFHAIFICYQDDVRRRFLLPSAGKLYINQPYAKEKMLFTAA